MSLSVMNLPEIILKTLSKATSFRPMAIGDLFDAVIAQGTPVVLIQFKAALAELIESRYLATMRHSKDGITHDLYWPTGLKPTGLKPGSLKPTIEKGLPAMPSKKPETGASTLNRIIVEHGPITGPDLALKTGIAARNIDTILERAKSTIVTRTGFVAERGRELKHYMTTTQAEEWDAREAAAHVMSAPESTKQSDDEIPVNETRPDIDDEAMPEPDAKLLAMANAMLSDRVANLETSLSEATESIRITGDLLDLLDIEWRDELIPRIKEIVAVQAAQSTTPNPETVQPGRLALLLIDSADLTEIEELDQYDAPNAQQLAVRNIEQGHAARAVVVRILGEARRQVEWKEAA